MAQAGPELFINSQDEAKNQPEPQKTSCTSQTRADKQDWSRGGGCVADMREVLATSGAALVDQPEPRACWMDGWRMQYRCGGETQYREKKYRIARIASDALFFLLNLAPTLAY